MFIEERIYILHPGKVPEFLRHWDELAKPAFTRPASIISSAITPPSTGR